MQMASAETYPLSLHDALPISSGLWRAFAAPYWTPELGGHMYRPLVITGFALDALVDGTVWFHAVNLRVEGEPGNQDRKSTRLNSSHTVISYAVFCLKKKKH